MKDLKDCNLLVVSERYPHIRDPISCSFVKNQVECIKDSFKKVYVISLTPYVPKFLSIFAFMDGKGRWDGHAKDYKYDNVEVYFAKPWAMPFEFSRSRRGDDSFLSAKRIIEKKKLEYDLIHAHFTYSAGYVGAKLKETSGKRLILTVHEDHNWLLNEIASKNEKLFYAWRSCDRIIRVNKRDMNEFKVINLDPSRLVYIPNGFSSRQFHSITKMDARERLKIPNDKLVLLNLASLEPYKGQEYLIRAMKIVAETRKDAVLYIVGKGSLKGYLQSLIDEYGLQEKIILAGGDKSAEEVTLWMNCCDLFVLPSISESFGIVQLEAMACGKPVIATYNGGSEEIIIDNGLGALVRPKDPCALAEVLQEAMGKNWDAKKIMDHASSFQWERIAERIAGLYKEVFCKGG